MKIQLMLFASIVALVALSAESLAADSPPAKGLVISAPGTFTDVGVWLYREPDGKYGFGPDVKGSNELLVMPPPSPQPGGEVAGVEIVRHPFDTLGYPLRIALVEKLFAASYQLPIYASNRGDLWKYEYGTPVINEKALSGGSRPAFKSWGPFPANTVPLSQAPDPEIQTAFGFAKAALSSIGNMPDSQKDLANYGVLFIDDGNSVWVELGPRFGPSETPHLGCQTQLGRDMVFGFDKKQPTPGEVGKFLQCF